MRARHAYPQPPSSHCLSQLRSPDAGLKKGVRLLTIHHIRLTRPQCWKDHGYHSPLTPSSTFALRYSCTHKFTHTKVAKSLTIFALQNVLLLLGRPLHWTLITIHQPTSFRKMPTLSTDGSKCIEWQLLGSPHQGPIPYNSTLCLQKKKIINPNIFCLGKLVRKAASFGSRSLESQ